MRKKLNEKTLLEYKPWIVNSKDHRAIRYNSYCLTQMLLSFALKLLQLVRILENLVLPT